MKKTVILDCDGIVYDFIGFALDHISKTTNEKLDPAEYKRDDFRSWSIYKKEHEEYFKGEGIAQKIPLHEGAQKFIEDLKSKDLDVIYCTSPYRNSKTWAYDRAEAIKRDFGDEPTKIVFARTGHKKHVQGMFLVDDHPKNCTTWSEFNRKSSVLFNRPWNESFRKNKELHSSFEHSDRNLLHLIGKEHNYGINCVNSYDDILYILKHIGV